MAILNTKDLNSFTSQFPETDGFICQQELKKIRKVVEIEEQNYDHIRNYE